MWQQDVTQKLKCNLTLLRCTITAKPNETDIWAVESEPVPKQLWIIASGAKAKNFYMVERKVEHEIWTPVTQPKFVGQAS